MSRPIGVALLGCGTVGREVLRLLTDQSAELAARVGTAVRLVGVAVRRPRRHPEVAAELLTTDAAELISRGEVERRPDGGWLLLGDPPEARQRPVADHSSVAFERHSA